MESILTTPVFWISAIFAAGVLAWLYYDTRKHKSWKESRQERMARLKKDAIEKLRAEKEAE
ncbi:hypothetical protein [Robiginitomaculum antarcticum]|uniref:hypothetical protein n=1 Tax=Robiginitomaculum antarcticum TaxID=437507 RepID=UPI00037EF074|nr:hypothetical protein [Robiginitomaculum antarcticum]